VDIMQHVEQNYVHELTPEERRKFIEAAIQGGLQSLDLHSGYINPREFKQFLKSSEGSFGGVGIQITVNRETKRLTVISPIVGTPAYKAGIKPGDEITKVNGVPTDNMTIEDAVDKIQGPPGTPVTLTIRHRGSDREIDLKIIRSRIEVESVLGDQRDADKQWDYLLDKENRIGYLRLVQFSKKAPAELRDALVKLKRQNVRGLVLDLRDNPGGLLEAAVEIADLFLTSGKIVSVEGRNRAPHVYEAKPDDTVLPDVPIVVLINDHSASASEIVAAALQDNRRAVVIGERSFGKGSVQNLIELEGGKSALKLTTAKYVRPSGKNIHRFPDSKEEDDWGVRPDIEVTVTREEELEYLIGRRERDIVHGEESPEETLAKIAAMTGPLGSGWTLGVPLGTAPALTGVIHALPDMPRAPFPFKDKVLERALEHLREKLSG
jgi:carboxyl-terminal processing protease